MAWRMTLLAAVLLVCVTSGAGAQEWKPVEGGLMTRWAKDVTPEKALPDYPRPTMTRKAWQNLNGLWDYAVAPRESDRPAAFEGKILVPFPIESALSGVKKRVDDKQRLWYAVDGNQPGHRRTASDPALRASANGTRSRCRAWR